MPSTTRSTPEPPSAETRRSAAIRAAAELNYTAQRVVKVLEVIVLRPSGAPMVAADLGISPRTARRILQTLTTEGMSSGVAAVAVQLTSTSRRCVSSRWPLNSPRGSRS